MTTISIAYQNSSSQLEEREKYELQKKIIAKEQTIYAALRDLDRVIAGDTHIDLHEVLAKLPGEPLTELPKQQSAQQKLALTWTSARDSQHRDDMYNATHNSAYVQRLHELKKDNLAARQAPQQRFDIPSTPLPLSFEAQQYLKRASGDYRSPVASRESSYAALFSKSGQYSSESLSFLTPSDRSPKAQMAERQQNQPHYRPTDPSVRLSFNAPATLPNLSLKVPPAFVPSCAEKQTISSSHYQQERMECRAAVEERKAPTPWL